MAQVDSTTTAVATVSDTGVAAIAASSMKGSERHARVVNEGGVAGFVSFDGGITKHRLDANTVVNTFYDIPSITSVIVYRIASGSNLSAIYASVW